MSEAERSERRRYFIVLMSSLLIVLGGMMWTLHVGKESNRYAHILGHERDGLESLQRYLKKQEARNL